MAKMQKDVGVSKKDGYWELAIYHQGRDVAALVKVPEEYSQNEAHCVANMVQRAISAFFGYREHEERIRDFVNHTAVGIPKKYIEKNKVLKLVQDYIGLAAATILGFHAYEKDMAIPEGGDDKDFSSPFGKPCHVGKKLDG